MKKSILLTIICALALFSCAAPQETSIPTNKKEIMDRFVEGTLDPSYVPAAFFIHFRPDQAAGEAAVQAHLEYFLKTNMDILKVQFEQVAPRMPGQRDGSVWENPVLMPEDFYAPTVGIIKRLQNVAGENAYVLPTVYNTLQVARQALSDRVIIEGAKEHPEVLKQIFDSYRDALIWFAKECKAIGIEGFYTSTQGGENMFNDVPGFFDNFVKAYDLAVMNECNKDTKMNILHICDWIGPYDDLTRFADYPGQIVNTPLVVGGEPFTLEDGIELFGRPVIGPLNRKTEILSASADEIKTLVNTALENAPAGKTMLGADCTVSTAPIANIQAAISAAHNRN